MICSLLIAFDLSSTTFEARLGIFKNWLNPKIKPSNQVKLFQIPDTHGMGFSEIDSRIPVTSSGFC